MSRTPRPHPNEMLVGPSLGSSLASVMSASASRPCQSLPAKRSEIGRSPCSDRHAVSGRLRFLAKAVKESFESPRPCRRMRTLTGSLPSEGGTISKVRLTSEKSSRLGSRILLGFLGFWTRCDEMRERGSDRIGQPCAMTTQPRIT